MQESTISLTYVTSSVSTNESRAGIMPHTREINYFRNCCLAMLVIHYVVVATVVVYNFVVGVRRAGNYNISDVDRILMSCFTIRSTRRAMTLRRRVTVTPTGEHEGVTSNHMLTNTGAGLPEGYRVRLTNAVADERDGGHYGYDADGNGTDISMRDIDTDGQYNILDIGYSELDKHDDKSTACGSYEKKNCLLSKHVMMICSNIFFAVYMISTKSHISNLVSESWSIAFVDISTVILVLTLVLIVALLWQVICLKLCVTTQILVESLSKSSVKVVYELHRDIKCWYAISVNVADIAVRSVVDGRTMYKRVKGDMIRRQRQCMLLRDDMESSMKLMSENTYKLVASNITGMIMFYIAVDSARYNQIPIASLFVVSIGLFVVSVWCTLVAACEMCSYANLLNQLRNITIDVNLIGACASINTSTSNGRESATLQSGRHLAWSNTDTVMSECQPRIRENSSYRNFPLDSSNSDTDVDPMLP